MRQTFLSFFLIAFLAGIIAPACNFLWGGKFSIVEICTGDGLETKLIADNTAPREPPRQAADHCPYCFNAVHLHALLTHPPVLLDAAAAQIKDRARLSDQIRHKSVLIAAPPRGPPLLG